ncbi:MAG: hypothetical protein Q7S50_03495 [bacterium]|nr:hypothetical protein [bacterium]
MSLDALIMLTGAFVALLPFLGFPNSWDTVFFFLAGVLMIALGIVVRRRLARKSTVEDADKFPDRQDHFAESISRHEDQLA